MIVVGGGMTRCFEFHGMHSDVQCLVIGEILTDRLIVVLNKVDLIPEATRADHIDKVHKHIPSSLANGAW
jgi:hypothetical protein